MFITKPKKEHLLLKKIPTKIKNKIRMDNVEIEGYDQAKKDVVEIINQLQIYLPYLDDDKELP